METDKALVRKRETRVIVVDGRIEQNLRMRLKMRKGCVMVQLVVEDLHHDVGAGEVGKPVAKYILLEQPPPDPAALDSVSTRLSDNWLREHARLFAEPIVDSWKRATRYAGNHIDFFQQFAFLQLEHDGSTKVRRAAPASGDRKREKTIVLRFEFAEVPRACCLRHRFLADPLFVPSRAPVAWDNGAASDHQQEAD